MIRHAVLSTYVHAITAAEQESCFVIKTKECDARVDKVQEGRKIEPQKVWVSYSSKKVATFNKRDLVIRKRGKKKNKLVNDTKLMVKML